MLPDKGCRRLVAAFRLAVGELSPVVETAAGLPRPAKEVLILLDLCGQGDVGERGKGDR